MYKQALGAFVAHFSIFLVYAAAATFLEELNLGTSFLGVGFVLSALLAFYCHRMILLGDEFGWDQVIAKRRDFGNSIKLWPFLWRVMVSTVLFILLVFTVYWQLRGFVVTVLQGPDVLILGLIFSGLIVLPFFGAVLALFGTVFPAAAINDDASLSKAFARGKKRFWITLWRLFAGFFCFTAVTMAAYIWGAIHFGYETADDGSFYYVFSFFGTLLGSFSALLAATALSMSYREAEALLLEV